MGVHNHFHVQPNCSVEVVLFCVEVGVVTIFSKETILQESQIGKVLNIRNYLRNEPGSNLKKHKN